jgi:hypothetical protein
MPTDSTKDKKLKRYRKHGFPNVVRKKKLLSMQEIFDDLNMQSKLLTKSKKTT